MTIFIACSVRGTGVNRFPVFYTVFPDSLAIMISRTCFVFCFLLYACTPAPAISSYQSGDTLYVWAVSGLSLRQSPDLKAAKLDNIPHGAALVARNGKYSISDCPPVQVEAVPGHKNINGVHPPVVLQGCFIRVEFNGKKGYVFDGYLSKLPAMRFSSCKFGPYTDWKCFEDFDTYAAREFGRLAEFIHIEDTTVGYGTLKRIYGNGITHDGWFDKIEERRIILPDISLEEGFLIFNNVFSYEQEIRRPLNDPNLFWTFTETKDLMKRVVSLQFGNESCTCSIRWLPSERIVVITWDCSC